MEVRIQKLESILEKAAANKSFVHHSWFYAWHLQIVVRMAHELCQMYPAANRDLVTVMAWMHDYGKMLVGTGDEQYDATTEAGERLLQSIGFDVSFAKQVVSYIQIMDSKMTVDLREAPIEVQIVATADGCSHFVGPFLDLWWYENAHKTYEELMTDTVNKIDKDWNRKIVLPEARRAFESRYRIHRESSGILPETFFDLS